MTIVTYFKNQNMKCILIYNLHIINDIYNLYKQLHLYLFYSSEISYDKLQNQPFKLSYFIKNQLNNHV